MLLTSRLENCEKLCCNLAIVRLNVEKVNAVLQAMEILEPEVDDQNKRTISCIESIFESTHLDVEAAFGLHAKV